MKKVLLLCLALVVQTFKIDAVVYKDWVEWDQIQHWAGDPDGEKKCALVIDFQDIEGMESLVWGYRWNGTKTGEDLIRAVASQSSILTAMIQYTGTMGSTLNALGVSANREELDYLHYDFDRAAIGGEVSFGFFEPNVSMGQEVAPGYDAEQMCIDAINRAKETGIIEHPLNAFFYGYPAYDYDYWQLEDGYEAPEYRWRSGWYDGYWSYWHGPNDYDYMGYSGLGMSSTVLTDGCVQAWKYIIFNGGGIGYMGGELAETLNYDMADWGEEMHEASETLQPVDQSDVTFWVGSGEKAATVIFQFNDGRGPENLVYGYRWSGGWDDDMLTVITNIANADPRMSFSRSGSQLMLTYDSDHDGKITSAYDHIDVSDTWNCYVKRTIDADFNKVNSGRWLNPNAVMIFSHQPKETASVELPYVLFRPALDSEQILTVPSYIDYALADKNLELPVFIQLPEGGKINTAFTWIKYDFSMLSATNVQNLMGHVTAYSNFAPTEGSVQIRGSYTAPGTTKAEYVFSNNAKIVLRNPVRPVTSMSYMQPEVDVRLSHAVDNTLVIEPADATYTKMTYKSSNTKAATVASTGVVTTTKTAGNADITATYALNTDITAGYSLTSSLKFPVEDITFEAVGEDGVLTLTPKEMTGLFPIFTPADPDIADVTVTLSENGSAMSDYIATMYKVNLWDENNTRMTPYELSGHRTGECTLTVEATDGSGFKKEIPVRVVEPERESVIDYTTGTIMLNEEWFGHTNGGLNWFAPDYSVTYQAYERENPGMSFGCTSQYGLIYNDKLIVSSKQAADGGDPLP
ncbi:MAG: Ig-like domain-containing protein, partial [Muribaculaceae bacterium]|nr:Ig-like domain-containing protein [Muribaculaceae bacterium]